MLNPEYDPRTLYVPKEFLDNETPVKYYRAFCENRPRSLSNVLLFSCVPLDE